MEAQTDSIAAVEPSAAEAERSIEPLVFTGRGGEYFRIWIVNLLLTVVTLGIYSAWAKVRRLRYFYGNTRLADSAFEYHAQPIQILKGRLLAVVLFVVYSLLTRLWPLTNVIVLPLAAIALPWIIVRSRRFQMHMSSWRGLRFAFHGQYRGALGAYVGWFILAVITFYVLLPVWLYQRIRFLLGNTSFGSERFVFEKTAGDYVRLYFKTGLLSLALAILLVIAVVAGQGGELFKQGTAELFAFSRTLLFIGLGVLAIMLVSSAYYRCALTNANFDGLRIGPHRVRCRLQTVPLLWLYVTNLLGMALTLGLFYPWARVRIMRYQIESMSVETVGSLAAFVAAASPDSSAVGEEISEVFDVDFGL